MIQCLMPNLESSFGHKVLSLLETLPRGEEGGIAYHQGGPSSVEATALAWLAAFAHGCQDRLAGELDWMSACQRADGRTPLFMDFPEEGGWATAPATFVFARAGLGSCAERGLSFLAERRSLTFPPASDGEVPLDTTIPGWPWRQGAFGWVEPTAWAVLAFEAGGQGDHPRAVEGRRLLLDRSIAQGGWNYGNREAFDQELVPFWDTTALAILALTSAAQDARFIRGLDFLARDLDSMASPYSLALSVLALEAGNRPVFAAKERLRGLLESGEEPSVNSVTVAWALMALGTRKVFTP